MAPTPVVALNRAVAVAMADGPAAGLALVDELDAAGELAGYYLLAATRADLLRRMGHDREAAVAYRAALDLAGTDTERRYLARRLGTLARFRPVFSEGARHASSGHVTTEIHDPVHRPCRAVAVRRVRTRRS
jgi:hypothetical protein